jgi:hypothetical protein
VRQVEQDGEHLWLRQSVTFSVDGQSRTLEIGIPLRAGATPDEIEALLAEADAGMERIGQHLEARIARLGGKAAPVTPAMPAPPAAGDDVTPPAQPAPSATPTPAAPPRMTIAERPAPTPAAPTQPAATAGERTTAPRASAPSPAPTEAGAPLTLKDFLATVQAEQGLNSKQVMEKLGVKSLAGLNLGEALEMLRRQALRDGVGTPPAPAAPPSASPAAPAAATPSSPAPTPPRYFEEEDDEATVSFTEEEDDDFEDEAYDALDDVPDFGAPAEPLADEPPAAHMTTTPQTPSTPAAPTEAAPAEDRAARILAHMRSVRGGGVPNSQQRTAFKNIVLAELGESKAKALIAGIWNTAPEKLGPEQLDVLNNWGKRDTFAEDTELVLAAIEIEHDRTEAEADGSPSAAPARGSTRRTSRAAPTGGA